MAVMERRHDLRAPVSLVGGLNRGEGEAPVIVLDLSSTGARIQTDDPADEGGEYLLHFTVHHTEYRARYRVCHCIESNDAYQWGGSFIDLEDDRLAALQRAVYAAAGLASTTVRPWPEILEEAFCRREELIVVGSTPSGHEIRLSGADCLDVGAEGIDLFVRTVAGLENT